jgi:hypothetical protein
VGFDGDSELDTAVALGKYLRKYDFPWGINPPRTTEQLNRHRGILLHYKRDGLIIEDTVIADN